MWGLSLITPTKGLLSNICGWGNSWAVGLRHKNWLRDLEQRTHSFRGSVQHLNPQELVVTIPFATPTELETRFNQFFLPLSADSTPQSPAVGATLPHLPSHLSLHQSNFLWVVRNHLSYDLDLRSLGVVSAQGEVLISPSALVALEFHLQTPWGAREVHSKGAMAARVDSSGALSWVLAPGSTHHLEAVFWLPSPLGIGTTVIVLFVIGGYYWKERGLKISRPPSLPDSVPTTSR